MSSCGAGGGVSVFSTDGGFGVAGAGADGAGGVGVWTAGTSLEGAGGVYSVRKAYSTAKDNMTAMMTRFSIRNTNFLCQRIKATAMQRMAAKQSSNSERDAANQTMPLNRF